ncbi:uncharacterized protein LOC129730856 [Wyeomyia smithii]|uniref:uncharacterized protein LOC129730856 n=1 Tax=Wyeomyia smithii TaxID=174621 RepID=UPI002467C034|nr:uncharacterized protein LOC129730856 [Wyeomyia smithii]
MVGIQKQVLHQHASSNTVYYCLYGYYFLGFSKNTLAKIYAKHRTTVSNWIKIYEENKIFKRKDREQVYLKFNSDQRRWLVNLYKDCPILYLDETKSQFERRFHKTISTASICRILHEEGLSWKVLERRAIQIRMLDIYRFASDMSLVTWDIHSLVFLDEASCDNRSMLRNKGYAPVGQKIIYRGEFLRRPRCSLLSFIGYNRVLDTYSTEGTFTREKFFNCVRSFATSRLVQRNPGAHSVWILDGARIHCHKSIIEYLRSLGIVVVFLPAYAPFFNPIEFLFGYLKKYLKRVYVENSSKNLTVVIAEAFRHFTNYDFTRVFANCCYLSGGQFDPSRGLGLDIKKFGFET